MKLKFVESLNEADIGRGDRLLKLKEINKNIQSAVEAAGYDFKDEGDKGFYILPESGFIVKISLDKVKDENSYTATIIDARHKKHDDLTTKVLIDDSFDATLGETVITNALSLIFQITATDVTRLQTVVSEALPLPKFLQTAINKINDNKDIKAKQKLQKQVNKIQGKLDSNDFSGIVKQCETIVEKSLAEMVGKTRDIKFNVQGKDGHIDIIIKSDVIAGVSYETNYIGKSLKVSKCITAINEIKVSCSLAAFISLINRKLGLKIQLKNDELLKVTGSSDAEIKKINSFESSLTGILGDDILTKLGESLNEALGDDDELIKKYDAALLSVKDVNQGIALVKLYFYRGTDKKIELTDTQALALYKDIKKAGSFDSSKSTLVAVFVNYYNINKDSTNLMKELGNLITNLTFDNFISKIKDINDKESLIYNSSIMGNAVPSTITHDLYNKYLLVKNMKSDGRFGFRVTDKLKNIKDKLQIEPMASAPKTPSELANFMIFTDFIGRTGIRSIEQIRDIFDIIGPYSQSVDTKDSSIKQSSANSGSKKLEAGLTKDNLSKLQQVFQLKSGVEGPDAVKELSDKLRDEKDIKNLLTQLLTQLK